MVPYLEVQIYFDLQLLDIQLFKSSSTYESNWETIPSVRNMPFILTIPKSPSCLIFTIFLRNEVGKIIWLARNKRSSTTD